jgi:hypothetical protein
MPKRAIALQKTSKIKRSPYRKPQNKAIALQKTFQQLALKKGLASPQFSDNSVSRTCCSCLELILDKCGRHGITVPPNIVGYVQTNLLYPFTLSIQSGLQLLGTTRADDLNYPR